MNCHVNIGKSKKWNDNKIKQNNPYDFNSDTNDCQHSADCAWEVNRHTVEGHFCTIKRKNIQSIVTSRIFIVGFCQLFLCGYVDLWYLKLSYEGATFTHKRPKLLFDFIIYFKSLCHLGKTVPQLTVAMCPSLPASLIEEFQWLTRKANIIKWRKKHIHTQ